MASFSLIVCFILGLASLVYPLLDKHLKDKEVKMRKP